MLSILFQFFLFFLLVLFATPKIEWFYLSLVSGYAYSYPVLTHVVRFDVPHRPDDHNRFEISIACSCLLRPPARHRTANHRTHMLVEPTSSLTCQSSPFKWSCSSAALRIRSGAPNPRKGRRTRERTAGNQERFFSADRSPILSIVLTPIDLSGRRPSDPLLGFLPSSLAFLAARWPPIRRVPNDLRFRLKW